MTFYAQSASIGFVPQRQSDIRPARRLRQNAIVIIREDTIMKMKKLTALLLASVMALSMAACGSTPTSNDNSSQDSSSAESSSDTAEGSEASDSSDAADSSQAS